MGFWSLLEVASMPVIEVLLISILGAFMATDYCQLFPSDARNSLNKIVFVVFGPCLMFANLAKTVTLQAIISWWFMPINMGLTFLFGGFLGWIFVKVLKPKPYLEGLIIAACSSGNLGNLPIVLVPAICDEDGGRFGNRTACRSIGLSYASFSMALGGFYIWTYTYQLIRGSAEKFKALEATDEASAKPPNDDLDADHQTRLLKAPEDNNNSIIKCIQDVENQATTPTLTYSTESRQLDGPPVKESLSFWGKGLELLHQILEELLAPPTLGAILGFIFGATNSLKGLIIGEGAPFRVIQDSIQMLGDGTIPCTTLVLGGNLIKGLRSSSIKPSVIVGVVCVRYIILPAIGIGIVKAAEVLGFLPADPLFQYVLMLQFTLPPAMNIGTMTQLFNVGQDECSVLFLWTYLVAALALTVWSTIFLSFVS